MTKIKSQSAKTGNVVDVIRQCAKNNGYIFCSTLERANDIYKLSKKLGLKIHMPIVESQFNMGIRKETKHV